MASRTDGRDSTIVDEVGPLASSLVLLLGRPSPTLGFLDEYDPLLQSREVEEGCDLGCCIEGRRLSEEDSGVECCLELLALAGRLDNLEEVYVRLDLLACEESLECIVVGCGTVAAVRDKGRLSEVPWKFDQMSVRVQREQGMDTLFFELALRSIETEEREL